MKPALALLVALLIFGAIILLRRRHPGPNAVAPAFRTTDELIAYLAGEARDIAKKDYQIDLDGSIESIQRVEDILGKLHGEYLKTKPTEGVQGLASAFGAYVGEAIRKSYPGSTWAQDHPVGGEKSYPLTWQGGESFPMAWCYKRIVNGPEDNVWNKYSILKDRKDTPK